MGSLSRPLPLQSTHELDSFICGEEVLDHWLKRRALKNEVLGASRTFVICSENHVVGYYALATGSVVLNEAPSKLKHNMPDPILVIILGRLAIDQGWQSKGIGQALLKDAVIRSLQVAQQVGVKALLVHALSESAKQFYLHQGFSESPLDSLKLFLPLPKLAQK